MAVPKAKLLALFAVAMMVVSMTCVVYAGEDSKADSSKMIQLGKSDLTKSYFTSAPINATCDDASYEYDGSSNTGTLRIKNFTFVTSSAESAIGAIDGVSDIHIVVEGNNTVSSKGATDSSCIGGKANVIISGDAGSKLTLVTGDASNSSRAIALDKGAGLTVMGGLTLDITVGNSSTELYGINAASVSIEDSTVSIACGNASGEGTNSCGIFATALSITGANTILKSEGGTALTLPVSLSMGRSR